MKKLPIKKLEVKRMTLANLTAVSGGGGTTIPPAQDQTGTCDNRSIAGCTKVSG